MICRTIAIAVVALVALRAGLDCGEDLHRELAHLHESGLSTVEGIRAATLGAARFPEARGDSREDLNYFGRIRAVVVHGVRVEGSPSPPDAQVEKVIERKDTSWISQ